MKKLLTAVTVAVLAVSAGVAQAKDWKQIRIGVDASYAPFESKSSDDTTRRRKLAIIEGAE